ncbi:MAG: hypothetical protein FK734_10650, partial [Asgard group archaeon]|nr:hypothetical protein [Asgard group archaeon]
MFGTKKRSYRGDGNGFVWSDTGSKSPGTIKSIFGPRAFPSHIATTGHNYNFHRGIDILGNCGDPVYS